MVAATGKLTFNLPERDSLRATAEALAGLSSGPFSFEAIAEQLPLVIVVLDTELRIRFVNRAARAALDLNAASATGRRWADFAGRSAGWDEICARTLSGEAADIDGLDVVRNGSERRIEGLGSPLRDLDGRILGVLILGRDVTERLRAAETRAASEERFRALAESSQDMIAELAADGAVLYVNPAVQILLGYTPAELIGTNGFELVHPEDAPMLRTRLEAVRRSDTRDNPPPVQYRVRHRNGTWRWIEGMQTRIESSRSPGRVLIAARDVTERRLADEALRQSEERYRLATLAMNGVIFEWNLTTDRLIRTPGTGAWLQMPEERLPGSMDSWLELLHPDDRRSVSELRDCLERDGQLEWEYRIRTPCLDHACLWERSILVRDVAGMPQRVVGFLVNRTDTKRTQRLLEATERAARIGGWEQNFRTGRLYWTDEIFRLYDLAPDRAAPEPNDTYRFFAPSAVPVIGKAVEAARLHGRPFDIETRMVSAAGRIWWARIVGNVERDPDGRPLRVYGALQDVTDRKQVEIELKTKSGWLEVALSTARMSAWRLDLISGEVSIAARSATLSRLAYQPSTLEALYSVMHPDDRPGVEAALERAIRSRAEFTGEYRLRMVDGTWSWKYSVGRIEEDGQGCAVALIGATEDITDRKRAEQGLRESERTLRRVTENSTDSLTLLDRDLRIRFINRASVPKTVASMEGRPLAEFLRPEDVDRVLGCLRRVLATGEPDRYPLEYPDGTGGTRYFEFRVSPVMDRGVAVGLAINGSDVTRHVYAERAIATQARMIECMLEGVAVVDAAQRIRISNPAFDRMFGYPRGALLGLEMAALSGSMDDADSFWGADAGSRFPRETARPIEFAGLRRDGTAFAVAGIVTPFEVAGRDHRLLVLQDVSERKALEREILEASNREQQRIGADLHDGLGQELTGIALMLKGVAGRLATEYPALLPEVDGITRLVSGAVESTRALARGLSPVTLERRGLIDALEGLAMRARGAYGIAVDFKHRIGNGVELDQTLADHLYRIAQEALTNAMRHGGARNVELKLTTRSGRIRLQVADDGGGIPADALDAPGLGLKIMRYRARMMGGEIRFEKSRRRGTQVVCDCPVRMVARQRCRTRSATRHSHTGDDE